MHEGTRLVKVGHSPDPDDAFMWWPIQRGKEKVDCDGFVFELHSYDIEVWVKVTVQC